MSAPARVRARNGDLHEFNISLLHSQPSPLWPNCRINVRICYRAESRNLCHSNVIQQCLIVPSSLLRWGKAHTTEITHTWIGSCPVLMVRVGVASRMRVQSPKSNRVSHPNLSACGRHPLVSDIVSLRFVCISLFKHAYDIGCGAEDDSHSQSARENRGRPDAWARLDRPHRKHRVAWFAGTATQRDFRSRGLLLVRLLLRFVVHKRRYSEIRCGNVHNCQLSPCAMQKLLVDGVCDQNSTSGSLIQAEIVALHIEPTVLSV